MTTLFLIPELKEDEGFRADAYPDPIHGWAIPTIGYGHTGREVHKGLTWTEAQGSAALSSDIASTEQGLTTALPWWTTLDDIRQDAIVNMAFNMGVHTLMAFNTFLAYMKNGQYADAALDLRGTPWFHEVGDRAVRIMQRIRSGQ